MLLLDCSTETAGLSHLLEVGEEVNVAADAFVQSPAHLAAHGGHAFLLLWQLQTGANLNQQDWLGEAPIHKAAKAGSLECIALLVASHANIDLRNNSGQTAEDLALALGYLDCAQFLTTAKHIQNRTSAAQSCYYLHSNENLPGNAATRQKRACTSSRSISRKRLKPNV